MRQIVDEKISVRREPVYAGEGFPWPYDGPVPDDVCALCSVNHCHLCEDVLTCQCDHGYEWPSSGPWEALFRFSPQVMAKARRTCEADVW